MSYNKKTKLDFITTPMTSRKTMASEFLEKECQMEKEDFQENFFHSNIFPQTQSIIKQQFKSQILMLNQISSTLRNHHQGSLIYSVSMKNGSTIQSKFLPFTQKLSILFDIILRRQAVAFNKIRSQSIYLELSFNLDQSKVESDDSLFYDKNVHFYSFFKILQTKFLTRQMWAFLTLKQIPKNKNILIPLKNVQQIANRIQLFCKKVVFSKIKNQKTLKSLNNGRNKILIRSQQQIEKDYILQKKTQPTTGSANNKNIQIHHFYHPQHEIILHNTSCKCPVALNITKSNILKENCFISEDERILLERLALLKKLYIQLKEKEI